jgi:hypothetical protein
VIIGKIIFSIDNIFEKIKSKADRKNDDGKTKNYDDLDARCEHAIVQLDKIQNYTNFKVKLCSKMQQIYK